MAHKAWQELAKVNHAMVRVCGALESTLKVESNINMVQSLISIIGDEI
jgi:hypothetical protein